MADVDSTPGPRDAETSEAAARILRWTRNGSTAVEPAAPETPPLAERLASVSRTLGRIAARLGESRDE